MLLSLTAFGTRGAAHRAGSSRGGVGRGAVRCQNAADTKRSARPQRCAGRNEGSRADPAQRARHGEAEAARRAAEWARAGKAVARYRESSAGSGEPERRGNSWRRGRNFPARRFHLFLLTAIPTAALPTSCPRAVLGAAPGRGADLGARQHRRSRRLHAAHAGSLPFRRAVPCRAGCRAGWGRMRAAAARGISLPSKGQRCALPFGGSARPHSGIRVLFATAKHVIFPGRHRGRPSAGTVS